MAVIVVEPGYAGALRTSRVRPPSDGEQPAAGGVITRHVSDLPPEEQARYRPLLRSDLEAAIAAGQCVVDVARGFNRTTNQVCALLDRFGLRMRGYMAYDGAGKRARAVQQQQLESARSDITLEQISALVTTHPEWALWEVSAGLGCARGQLVTRLQSLGTTLTALRRGVPLTSGVVAAVLRRQHTPHINNVAAFLGRTIEEFEVELRGLGIDLDALRRQALAENPDPQDQAAAEEVRDVSTPQAAAPQALPPNPPTIEMLLAVVSQYPQAPFESIAAKVGLEPLVLGRLMQALGVSLTGLRKQVAAASPGLVEPPGAPSPPPLVAPEPDPAAPVPRHPTLDRDNLQAFLNEFPAADFKEMANHFGIRQRALPKALDGIGVTADVLDEMRRAGMTAARARSGAPEAAAPSEPPAAADLSPELPATDPTPAEPEPTGTPAVPSFASREERYVPDRERLLAYLRANPTAGREAIARHLSMPVTSLESWVRVRFGRGLAHVRADLGLPALSHARAAIPAPSEPPEPVTTTPEPAPAGAQGEGIPGVVEEAAADAEGPLPELTEPVVLRASPAATEAGEVQLGGLAALRTELTSSYDPHIGPPTPAADVVAAEGPIQAEAYRLSGEWALPELVDKVIALKLLLGAGERVRVTLEYRR